MGRIVHESDSLVFVSDNGVKYDLLEGIVPINERKTSDIMFMMLYFDPEYIDNELDEMVRDGFVAYFYGATFIASEKDKSGYIEMMDSFAKKYEDKHPEVVKYYQTKRVRMIRRILNTVGAYLRVNREVLEEKDIKDLEEQIEFLKICDENETEE